MVQTESYIFTHFTNNIWSYLLWPPVIVWSTKSGCAGRKRADYHHHMQKKKKKKLVQPTTGNIPNIHVPGAFYSLTEMSWIIGIKNMEGEAVPTFLPTVLIETTCIQRSGLCLLRESLLQDAHS